MSKILYAKALKGDDDYFEHFDSSRSRSSKKWQSSKLMPLSDVERGLLLAQRRRIENTDMFTTMTLDQISTEIIQYINKTEEA